MRILIVCPGEGEVVWQSRRWTFVITGITYLWKGREREGKRTVVGDAKIRYEKVIIAWMKRRLLEICGAKRGCWSWRRLGCGVIRRKERQEMGRWY